MESLIIEIPGKGDMDATVESILQSAAARSWKNPATHNLRQILLNFGKEVRPVKVIELCRPDYSFKILEMNDERSAAVFMPCRISVYEKEDGKAYISLMNPLLMTGLLPEPVAQVMVEASDELMEVVREAIG
ncbi:MAG: DUF302 domain-containing protein [Bacteroidales bacterium]